MECGLLLYSFAIVIPLVFDGLHIDPPCLGEKIRKSFYAWRNKKSSFSKHLVNWYTSIYTIVRSMGARIFLVFPPLNDYD